MWLEAGSKVRRLGRASFLVAFIAATFGSALAQSPAPIEGTWRTLNGTEVTIAPCGGPGEFCGNLSWVVIPKEHTALCQADKAAFATKMLDYQNPDPAQRTRPILGLPIMSIKQRGRDFDVSVYSPEDGKTYKGSVFTVNDGTTLRLGNGCVFGVCVVTQDWPRVPPREVSPDFTCGGDTP